MYLEVQGYPLRGPAIVQSKAKITYQFRDPRDGWGTRAPEKHNRDGSRVGEDNDEISDLRGGGEEEG